MTDPQPANMRIDSQQTASGPHYKARLSPEVYDHVLREIENPRSGLDVIATVLLRDPVLSQYVLTHINSAVYGLSEQVYDVPQAVALLGTNKLVSFLRSLHPEVQRVQAEARRSDAHVTASD